MRSFFSNQIHKQYRLVALLLAVSLALLFVFVQKDGELTQSDSQSEAFEQYMTDLFRLEVCSDRLSLHYSLSNTDSFSEDELPSDFGTYTPGAICQSAIQIENVQSVLSSFSYDSLSLSDRLTYDVLEFSLQNEKILSSYPQFYEPLSANSGLHSELPILLAEYSFQTVEDVEDYLSLLATYDSYLSELAAFEQYKSEEGTLMSEANLTSVIEQCKSFVDAGDDNILLTSFENRINALDGLSDFQRESYVEANEIIVTEKILPAYKSLAKTLASLPADSDASGLCNYPDGTSYYEALVAEKTGSSRSIEELIQMTEEARAADLAVIAEQLSSGVSYDDLTSDASFSSPDEMLSDLQEKITDEFYSFDQICPDTEYTIKEVDSSLGTSLAPAFYLTCPIDDASHQVIYINPAFEYDTLSLYTTLAHEAFPGHLYQTCCAHAANLPNIRYLLSFKGYSEGWATYVEMLSYSYLIEDEGAALTAMHNNAATLSLYATADFGIHYSGWTVDDLSDFLASYGIRSADTAEEIYQAILSDPAGYLSYYIGYLEFLALKEKATSTYGDDFDVRQFHQAVLSMGAAPFSVLEKYLDAYYSLAESSAESSSR
jgi:uncharacterized protein (DUF885 family)